MFIVACFSTEMRNTTATSEEAITLAKSSRRDRSNTKEVIATVTATANQNRAALGSVQNNKIDIVLRSASAPVAAIYRVPAPGMANASGSPPFFRTAPMSCYCHNAESRRMPFDERLARGDIDKEEFEERRRYRMPEGASL